MWFSNIFFSPAYLKKVRENKFSPQASMVRVAGCHSMGSMVLTMRGNNCFRMDDNARQGFDFKRAGYNRSSRGLQVYPAGFHGWLVLGTIVWIQFGQFLYWWGPVWWHFITNLTLGYKYYAGLWCIIRVSDAQITTSNSHRTGHNGEYMAKIYIYIYI